MASITSFNAVRELAVTQGNPKAYGLCSDPNSESGVGVQGDGLGGMQIKVTRTDGTGPRWTGTLSNEKNENTEWIANLTCVSPGPHVGSAIDLGDPEDVSVTVQVGTNLARLPPVATLPPVTVKVGPAPT
jgi:hypothetical protein